MIRHRFCATVALGLLAALTMPQSVHADGFATPNIASASGTVYTADNSATGNEVLAYRRAADGSLSYLGVYATGGRGSGGTIDPLQSQNSLILSDDHRFLFVVNSGSGDITAFEVQYNGRLVFVDRIPSRGGFPVGLAVHGSLLYVLNAGGAGGVSGFRIQNSGHLAAIPHSTQLLSAGTAGAASIDISPDGKVLAATERLTNRIDTFPLAPNGAAGPLVADNSNGKVPFSLTFTPQGALVVAEAAGNPAGGSALSSYFVQSDGSLTVSSASVPTGFSAACWVVATANGNFAYAANAASSVISISTIGNDGQLTTIGSASTGSGSVPLDLALNANNRFLYVLTAGTGTITGFQVQANGSLVPLGTVHALPAASGQNGLAAY